MGFEEFSCYQSQNYKIWKQFTTSSNFIRLFVTLLSITKLQNLKAIHNSWRPYQKAAPVVINHKTTKFESNSQRAVKQIEIAKSCYQSQNYEIWKQFTTARALPTYATTLLSITKLRNLKAIHNSQEPTYSQRPVVINHKTTKFESNSQRSGFLLSRPGCCYQSQNYKIWKQFTTTKGGGVSFSRLLSITKLQNLKAIHNNITIWTLCKWVVINHKTTKFESNSQLSVQRSYI